MKIKLSISIIHWNEENKKNHKKMFNNSVDGISAEKNVISICWPIYSDILDNCV